MKHNESIKPIDPKYCKRWRIEPVQHNEYSKLEKIDPMKHKQLMKPINPKYCNLQKIEQV